MEFPFFSNHWNYPPYHRAGVETPATHWETPEINRQTRYRFPRETRSRTEVPTNPHHWETPEMNRQTRYPLRSRMKVETPVVNRQTRSPFQESPHTGTEIPTVRSQARSQPPKTASKVVEIPVRFVGSVRSETLRTTAALKIQKVLRGLLVRKSAKKIAGIRKEVDEIEKRVSEKETILNMRRDAKERLKVNEMLMALLLRLDSIRGVDSGVRNFRKSVIKKAIMLQERVDAIVSGDIEMVETGKTMQMQEQEEECGTDEDSEHHNAGDYEPVVVEEEAGDQASELQHASVEYTPADYETTVESQDKFHTVSEVEDENLKEEEEEEDLMDIQQQPELIEGGEKKVEEENGSSNRDLMEIMIKGNERLTGLVTELCERQASQSRLLSSLSQRVENLEKAFRCEKSKRKKKRNSNINKP